jgi:hypothetical protein
VQWPAGPTKDTRGMATSVVANTLLVVRTSLQNITRPRARLFYVSPEEQQDYNATRQISFVQLCESEAGHIFSQTSLIESHRSGGEAPCLEASQPQVYRFRWGLKSRDQCRCDFNAFPLGKLMDDAIDKPLAGWSEGTQILLMRE